MAVAAAFHTATTRRNAARICLHVRDRSWVTCGRERLDDLFHRPVTVRGAGWRSKCPPTCPILPRSCAARGAPPSTAGAHAARPLSVASGTMPVIYPSNLLGVSPGKGKGQETPAPFRRHSTGGLRGHDVRGLQALRAADH